MQISRTAVTSSANRREKNRAQTSPQPKAKQNGGSHSPHPRQKRLALMKESPQSAQIQSSIRNPHADGEYGEFGIFD
jgi:hypothetical protein